LFLLAKLKNEILPLVYPISQRGGNQTSL